MLKITIPDQHGWNPVTEEFVDVKGTSLILEHSLVSLQKWESRWHKAYLGKYEKTPEEIIDYIKCMTITQNVNPEVYNYIPKEEIEKIAKYIDDPMTATTFSSGPGGGSRFNNEIVTAEVIYYWMIALNIPMEYRKWHLNQLITLIRVCEIKQNAGNNKKMGRGELNARNRALNAQRRAKLHSKG